MNLPILFLIFMLHLYPSILKAKQETNQSSSSVDTSSTSQSSKKDAANIVENLKKKILQ